MSWHADGKAARKPRNPSVHSSDIPVRYLEQARPSAALCGETAIKFTWKCPPISLRLSVAVNVCILKGNSVVHTASPSESSTRRRFLSLVACLAASSVGRPNGASAAELDNRYVGALQCVDDFLEAWRHRDAATGLALVSSHARKKYGDAVIRQFLSGTSSPSNAAFEIISGHAVSPTRYRFSIKRFFFISGGGLSVPAVETMDAVSCKDQTWKIDKLPL
jgi:hypothetical protein